MVGFGAEPDCSDPVRRFLLTPGFRGLWEGHPDGHGGRPGAPENGPRAPGPNGERPARVAPENRPKEAKNASYKKGA